MVERYDMDEFSGMVPMVNGDYVLYSDHLTLESDRDNYRKAFAVRGDEIENLHSDIDLCSDEVHKLESEKQVLAAENKRLRSALEAIKAHMELTIGSHQMYMSTVWQIANKALQEDNHE